MLFSSIYCGLDKSVGSTHLGAVGQRPVDSTPLLDGAILPILPTAGQVTHCACASLKIFSQSVICSCDYLQMVMMNLWGGRVGV